MKNLCIGIVAFFMTCLYAETLHVTSSSDDNVLGTLRYYAQGSYNGDVIQIDPSVTEISIDSAINITTAITIIGHDELTLKRGAPWTGALFNVNANVTPVTFEDFDFLINSTQSDKNSRAIVAQSPVVIDNVRFVSITAYEGGAINTSDSLTVRNSSFKRIRGSGLGGVISFTPESSDREHLLRIYRCQFEQNAAVGTSSASGGSIYAFANTEDAYNDVVEIIQSSFLQNEATTTDSSGTSNGGALFLSTDIAVIRDSNITQSSIMEPASVQKAAGVYSESLATTFDNAFVTNNFGIGALVRGNSCTVEGSTFNFNQRTGLSIFSTTCNISDSTFNDNTYMGFCTDASTTTLSLERSRVMKNYSGGARLLSSEVSIKDALFDDNYAAALTLTPHNESSVDIMIKNSTFSSNDAGERSGTALEAGGIVVKNSGDPADDTISIEFCTITDNNFVEGTNTTGGIFSESTKPVSLTKTIVVGNHSTGGVAHDIYGNVQSQRDTLIPKIGGGFNVVEGGHNLIGVYNDDQFDEANRNNDIIIANPSDARLGPLADNGGHTLTHALLPGSLAIDNGGNTALNPPDFDQRGDGFPRRLNDYYDIGAYESSAVIPMPSIIMYLLN
jgi:hypothetical protein